MVKKRYEVVWAKRSQLQLHAVFKYISESSPVNAETVVSDILAAV